MKIAYITEANITYESGITFKTRDQVTEWVMMGHDVIVYSLAGRNYSRYKTKTTGFAVKCYAFNFLWPGAKLRNLLNKFVCGYQLMNDLQHFRPDIVYYRQGMWFPALDNILRSWPAVMEVNTADCEEYKMEGNLKRWFYTTGRKRILKRLSGIVAVTNELAQLYRKECNLHVRTVSNGIRFYRFVVRGEVKQRPQLIFVGTVGVMPWQGEDKVIIMAKHLPQFDFHIVGGLSEGVALPFNVFSYGYLPADELKSIYPFIDVGIGTLALHRKGMEEASPLKVREYCRQGIPVIAAYLDTDLDGMACVLRIENIENNIISNLERINAFVWKWHGRRVDMAALRARLDVSVKERARIAFFEEIIAGKTKKNDLQVRLFNGQ